MPEPGDVLAGKYRIVSLLGEGGMGTVHLAEHIVLHQKVAIKVLRPELAQSPESVARFLREARAAAQIRGEHVAQVSDFGETPGEGAFMVLEYLEGEDLATVLEQRGPLPVAEAVDLVLEGLRGVAQAHALGIVHRDLKPANLFLARRADGTRVVKVLDFGISKVLESGRDANGFAATVTETKSLLGSPGYMSPEQVRSSRDVDARTDLWSVGVIIHRLLTGTAPFDGDSIGAVFARILEETPPPLDVAVPGVPKGLADAVARCLCRRREERWQNAAELADALAPFGSAEATRSADAIRRTLGVQPASRPRPHEEPPSSQARPSSSKKKRVVLGVVGLAAIASVAAAAVVLTAKPSAKGDAARASSAIPTPATSEAPDAARGDAAHDAIGLMDLPRPSTKSPQALAAYLAGMEALHDGARAEAITQLTRAAELDPTLGAAHLRKAIYQLAKTPTEARESFQRAERLRAELTSRDLELLEATRPHVTREPPDDAAFAERLESAVRARPGDAELWLLLGWARGRRGEAARAIEAYDASLAADPAFALALHDRAEEQTRVGDLAGARASLDRCVELPHPNAACLKGRIRLAQREGRCADIAGDARRWVTADPANPDIAYAYLAESQLATGQPADVVREEIMQRVLRKTRGRSVLHWERQLALLAGDFAGAERALLEQNKGIADSRSMEQHTAAALPLVRLYREMGRAADAADVAAKYLARTSMWIEPVLDPAAAALEDPTVELLDAERAAGALAPADFTSRRGAWVAAWRARVPKVFHSYVWLRGFASVAATRDEAVAALASLEELGPLPAVRSPHYVAERALGHLEALADRAPEASASLERVTKSCDVLHHVLEDTQARVELGGAYERLGRTSDACAQYRIVLDRWGKAKPRSITGERALARVQALRCKA